MDRVLHQAAGVTVDGASYTNDDAGNRSSKQNLLTGTTENYTYDAIYQLTKVMQGASTTESYSYDRVGNRLSDVLSGNWQYNASNQLTSTPSATFTYDNNGNMLTKSDTNSVTQYAWDYENRLTSVTLPNGGGVVTFTYDPFGRRIEKVTASATTIYAYDGANIVGEYDAAGALSAKYAQGEGIDQPLAMWRGGTVGYYQADGLGSITAVIDGTRTPLATYTYDAFGKRVNVAGQLTNPFQYTGREWDQETGLYYYRARYYDPKAGRFASEDPIGFWGGGTNFYSYVGNGPLDFSDPSGEQLVAATGGGSQGSANSAAFNAAIAYLSRNPGMAQVIQTLINSPETFYVVFDNKKDAYYCPSRLYGCGPAHTIHWNKLLGLICKNGGRLSPAVVLGHELAHAAGDGKRTRRLLQIPDLIFDNKEERRVITTYEIPAAQQFGEGIRWDHSGLSWYHAQSVTSQQGRPVPF